MRDQPLGSAQALSTPFGKGEVESSILSRGTINSSELSPVFFLKSRPAATHMGQKISSRLSATAVVKLRAIAKSHQKRPGSCALKTPALNLAGP
jgi:hypothetical protein